MRRVRQGDPRSYQKIVAAIRSLADEPLPAGVKKLEGFEPPAWRLPVGEYRIVYEVHQRDVLVIVVNVAPRGEVYR